MSGPAAVLLNGTVGSGKTSTAEAVGSLLAERGTPHALVDLDALRRSWPPPPDDPFCTAVELANLAAVAAVHRRSGAQRLVLSGVLEDPALRPAYAAAVGVPLLVVRLRVPLAEVEQRLRRRHAGDDDGGASLAWHLARSGGLHRVLEDAAPDDAVVDTTGMDRRATAVAVLSALGW